MKSNRVLYLFTGMYPFGRNIECFLEDEIVYLCDVFEHVVIVPTRGDIVSRDVPPNCTVTDPIFPKKLLFLFKGLFNKRAFAFVWSDFFNNRVLFNRKKLCVWIKGTLVTNNLLNSHTIKRIETELNELDTCYYYWGKWSNVLSWFWKDRCHHVSRFHGAWDLWEEEFADYAPFRKYIANSLDKVVFISSKGEKYFRERYSVQNTAICRLGSEDYGVSPIGDDCFNVVSCSMVYSLKRVPLIFESVCRYSRMHPELKINWTHIGGGQDFLKLKELVQEQPYSNLTVILKGNLPHTEVVEEYKRHHYDVFVNLSTSEGIPVSIMEAISFGIPVLATDVGSTSEVVNDQVGLLLEGEINSEQVAAGLDVIRNGKYEPRTFWENNYDARKNYGEMANLLINI